MFENVQYIKRVNLEKITAQFMYVIISHRWANRQRMFGPSFEDRIRKKIV